MALWGTPTVGGRTCATAAPQDQVATPDWASMCRAKPFRCFLWALNSGGYLSGRA